METKKINLVCFGGGTGLPSLLSGIKHNPWLEITAIVNMFDTGGSSGELRDKFGVLPPGDILKCLLALAEDEAAARKILLKRIYNDSFPGHTGGNVLLMGLEKVYGNHYDAVDALAQILSVKGKVVPVTLSQSTICAKYADQDVYKGETGVDIGIYEGKKIEKIFLEPSVDASPKALAAIERADAFCVGPGSFYTSVISNFLPVGIKESLSKSRAPVIFICNFLTEGLGMRGYTTGKMIEIIEKYIGRSVSAVIVNKTIPDKKTLDKYSDQRKYPVKMNDNGDTLTFAADLWEDKSIARHDSSRLANLVFAVINKLLK